MKKIFPNSLFITLIFLGCQSNVPNFDEDNAFSYLVAQCDFGPRNPGSDGYFACLDYLITELDQSANEIILQDFSYQEQRYNKRYNLENIIARYNPDSEFQTVISAHWDTRPWADQEDLRQDRDQPIIGANDGASGVAILLELARIMGENPPPIGVNLVFFDGEDLGVPGQNETYCQGSRFFAKNLPIPRPDEAINLDMVGDKQLVIPIERYSLEYHPKLVRHLWDRAKDMGLDAFIGRVDYAIYDDHIPLNEIAGIPSIDLIDFKYPNSYANFWHTLNDIPENCSEESLGQVGDLMVDYIYNREEQNRSEN
ncbi:MAG: M28 family peptidase [Candidatus Marinimicrobia bacterium]|nr:M28 family peptidase [Candidatus Neomarinimicrobiota bacterium]